MDDIDCVVWDFDGVLNRNIIDGRILWTETFEADHAVSLQHFRDYVFSDEFKHVLRGDKDLLAHVDEWVRASGYDGSAQDILDYWFAKDARPDTEVLAMIEAERSAGRKNVIATNNEPRRTAYIENEMGFGKRVDAIFSSGRLRCMKPEPEFFNTVSETLAIPVERLILVDDSQKNVDAAAALGWQTFHFDAGDHEALRRRLGLAG